MTKTKLTKITIDILMYADFIFLMSHGTVRNLSIHAYGGMVLFTLFVVHHILNGWFYKTVTKGKYYAQRILLNTTDWVLMVLMILMAASSVFATGAVFEWSSLGFNQFWRTVHLMSTSWGYMVMSFHLALHVHSPLKKLDGKVQSKIGKILPYIIYVLDICSCHSCRMFCLLQNTALLLSVQHWQLENGRRKYCDFVSGIYRNYGRGLWDLSFSKKMIRSLFAVCYRFVQQDVIYVDGLLVA